MFQAPANREPKPLLRRQTRFLNEVRVAKKAPEATWLPWTECHGRQKIQEGLPGAGSKPVASAWRRGQRWPLRVKSALGGFCPVDADFEISQGCAMAAVLSFFARWENSGNSSKKNGFQRKNLQTLTPSRVP